MRTLLPSALTASVSGEIRPGACVNIEAAEEILTPVGVVGILGIRQSLADRRLTLGATLIPGGWSGKPNIQLINHDEQETIYIRKGDELTNVVYLNQYVAQ